MKKFITHTSVCNESITLTSGVMKQVEHSQPRQLGQKWDPKMRKNFIVSKRSLGHTDPIRNYECYI